MTEEQNPRDQADLERGTDRDPRGSESAPPGQADQAAGDVDTRTLEITPERRPRHPPAAATD